VMEQQPAGDRRGGVQGTWTSWRVVATEHSRLRVETQITGGIDLKMDGRRSATNWRRPAGRPRKTWTQHTGDGTTIRRGRMQRNVDVESHRNGAQPRRDDDDDDDD